VTARAGMHRPPGGLPPDPEVYVAGGPGVEPRRLSGPRGRSPDRCGGRAPARPGGRRGASARHL